MVHFGQDTFERAQSDKLLCPDTRPCDPAKEYARIAAQAKRMAGAERIDRLLAKYKVDLLVQPTHGPAGKTTLGKGDAFEGPSASQLPAVAGYPHLTVPMGAVDPENLPVGLSFVGPKWADGLALRVGYAFEKAGPGLRVRPKI